MGHGTIYRQVHKELEEEGRWGGGGSSLPGPINHCLPSFWTHKPCLGSHLMGGFMTGMAPMGQASCSRPVCKPSQTRASGR